MKKYLLTLTLTALAASPALAATHHRTYNSQAAANAAYAYVAPGPDTVVVNGRVVGADPDLAVRSDLLRQGDPTTQNGN
jgi:ABC-type amino acid transport substrate-binding protein